MGELVTFGILVVVVVAIALVGGRMQTVQPVLRAGASGGTDGRRSDSADASASEHSQRR